MYSIQWLLIDSHIPSRNSGFQHGRESGKDARVGGKERAHVISPFSLFVFNIKEKLFHYFWFKMFRGLHKCFVWQHLRTDPSPLHTDGPVACRNAEDVTGTSKPSFMKQIPTSENAGFCKG